MVNSGGLTQHAQMCALCLGPWWPRNLVLDVQIHRDGFWGFLGETVVPHFPFCLKHGWDVWSRGSCVATKERP